MALAGTQHRNSEWYFLDYLAEDGGYFIGLIQASRDCLERSQAVLLGVLGHYMSGLAVEIVPQLLVSTTTPKAMLLQSATPPSESKITRRNGLVFPYQLREKIDLYLSQ